MILIGHVPIPYSGTRVSLDGHMSRTEGSWIADSYYGDLDGEDGVDWTLLGDAEA